jgi:hypothetical protein
LIIFSFFSSALRFSSASYLRLSRSSSYYCFKRKAFSLSFSFEVAVRVDRDILEPLDATERESAALLSRIAAELSGKSI